MVILINDLHDERDDSLYEDVPTLTEIAPLFEKVHKFLTEVSLTVVVLEELEKLWGDRGRHLSNELLIKL